MAEWMEAFKGFKIVEGDVEPVSRKNFSVQPPDWFLGQKLYILRIVFPANGITFGFDHLSAEPKCKGSYHPLFFRTELDCRKALRLYLGMKQNFTYSIFFVALANTHKYFIEEEMGSTFHPPDFKKGHLDLKTEGTHCYYLTDWVSTLGINPACKDMVG